MAVTPFYQHLIVILLNLMILGRESDGNTGVVITTCVDGRWKFGGEYLHSVGDTANTEDV
jgi:hypothetical protein